MARIPGFAYQELPSVADMGPSPIPQGQRAVVTDQSGEIKGQALEQFGNTVTNIGNQIQQKQDQFAYATAKTNFLQADIQAREALKDDPDYTTYEKRYTDAMTKARAEATKSITNPRDQQAFALDTQLDLTRGLANVRTMARTKEVDTGRANLSDMLDKNRVSALNSTDPAERSQLIGATTDAINGAKQRGYVSAQEAERLQKNWTQNYGEGFVKMMPWQDQVKTLQSPKGTPAEFIDPEQRVAMLRQAENQVRIEQERIEAEARRRKAELQADMKPRIQDTSAAYRAGLPVADAPTFREIKEAFPDDYREIYDSLLKDQRMGADLQAFASLSPQEVAARAEKYAVTAGGAGTADALARRDEILQAVRQNFAERQKDPRSYAIVNNLGSKPLDFSDPQSVITELSNRAANAQQTSRMVGFPTPMLSKDESKAFASMLDQSDPKQKALWLGTLSQKLGSDPYQALMQQMLPTKPIAAIAGSMISHANPATPPSWFDQRFAGDPTAPEKILQGEKLIGSKEEGSKGFPMPPDTGPVGTRTWFGDQVKNMFATRPELSEATYGAFKAAYAGLLADKGDLKGVGDSTLRQKALDMVIGKTIDVNGSTVAVPTGMDASKFKSLVTSAIKATATDAKAPADFADRIRGYQLRELGGVGSGRYQLIQGNAPLVRPDGKGFFTVDLRGQFGGR